jgi:hypothetical protein
MKKTCPKNIEESITESIIEGKELLADLKKHIEDCETCDDVMNELTILLGNEELDITDPGEEYFNNLWNHLDHKIEGNKTKKKETYKNFFQFAAVAFLFLSIGYWLGFGNSQNTTGIEKKTVLTSDYKEFKNRSKVLLTSVLNMDEYQATELLGFSIDLSKKLVLDLNELKNKYEDEPELLEELKQLERILIVLSSLKSGSITDFKVFQYGIKNNDIIEQI